ncbi:E3 ubiquitin-protein ligase RNF19A [Rhipicephalus sanguineus]|uniref:RBR-type E3 ubiquitin transferase n=1 Tax=Rhipicephalus sanguineus TaxID=34632 RepID=A0A9D4T1P4_RHISA|nr:E3 ubiquitin-protein ligase RNF19A [Rhipicephalus sanguineus]KAH7968235.1 hypothetical protein HPB52_007166 [Rhipicephalus sanguineus]
MASSAAAPPGSPEGGGVLPTRRHPLAGGRFSLRRLLGSSSSFLNRRNFGRSCSSPHDAEQAVRPPQRMPPQHRDARRNSSGSGGAASRLGAAERQGSSDTDSLWSCGGGLLECPLCLLEAPAEAFPRLASCAHRACADCLRQYLRVEISESRVNIACPACSEPMHPSDIRRLLQDELMVAKYESFMLRRVLVTEPDARWCPAPDCGYVVIASGCASCPKLRCERPGCSTAFCYHCKQEWHPNQTCDAARAQRASRPAAQSGVALAFPHDEGLQRDDIKHCPCCKVFIIKMDDGSCNHMTCRLCGTEFCWLCMKEVSDLHYLSPSGCTFWGKKPWSRKKKILWQLGMLVGAPVGIALIAGIAVPAIVIGIPVWVGRKLHSKYDLRTTSRLKRNFVVTSGVVASFLVSPIIAGIAVGIGVPILLAYIYGVVPVSLCRSGGCGVTTSASGVRIEFDEEGDGIGGVGGGSGSVGVAADGASVDTAGGIAPASIGEAASLGMSGGSPSLGSHLDTVAGASNTAIAGHSLTGSIASASAHSHRLEVQAEVSSNKRFSLSSHSETASATVSLSERSANMSGMADDAASTRALAGSIVGYREGTLAAPVEVHVDPSEEPDYCRQCRITHRPCCPNALASTAQQQSSPHCECLDTASVTKVQIE